MIVTQIFCTIYQELRPLIDIRISFPLYILRTNRQNFTKFYGCIHIDKIYVEVVVCHVLQICNRVMTLNLGQNFIFAQHLLYKLRELVLFCIYIDIYKIWVKLLHAIFTNL